MQAMVRRVRRLVALLALAALALPARGVGVDPSTDGPFTVGVTTLTFTDPARGRTLVTEVWYLAQAAGRDAPARRGRYPRVLVAHGYCGFRTNYEFLSGAFHERSGPARARAPLVRGRRAGLVGHSLGGAAVVHASLADPDLTAV